jgi:hypothetical protein
MFQRGRYTTNQYLISWHGWFSEHIPWYYMKYMNIWLLVWDLIQ